MEGHVLNADRCDDIYFNVSEMTLGTYNGIPDVYTLKLPNEISTTDRGNVYIGLGDYFFAFAAPFSRGVTYLCCAEVENDPILSLPVIAFCDVRAPGDEPYGTMNPHNPKFYKVRPVNSIGGTSSGIKELHFYFLWLGSGQSPYTTYLNLPANGSVFHGNLRISRSSFDDNKKYFSLPGKLRSQKRIKNLK
jgi:hypothetical protein